MKYFTEDFQSPIPPELPHVKEYDLSVDHAPERPAVLNKKQRKLAIANALRYFPSDWHEVLAIEFSEELDKYGHIYMYRFRPDYEMFARPLHDYPAKSEKAACIMLMIQNNLDPNVAQFPHELVT
jgi:urocanate hydratase